MDDYALDLAIEQAAVKLLAAGVALAELWDACRIVEGIADVQTDGVTDLVTTIAADCLPLQGVAPTKADCSKVLRLLFSIGESALPCPT